MGNYILIGICLVVILIMSIQLYRTYSWQKLLDKKQSEFINKPHVKANTKQYYAPLGMAMCCMLMVFVSPSTSMDLMGPAEVANESSESVAAFSAFDGISKDDASVTTAVGSLKQSTQLAETAREDAVYNQFIEAVNGTNASVSIMLEQVNPFAKEYSSDEIINILKDKNITATNETISDSDYLITVSNNADSNVVYALKEFENYYIICDVTYSECYYVMK